MSLVTGAEVEKDFRVMKTTLCASSQMEIRTDLMDPHFYAFYRSALLDVLDQYPHLSSLKQNVVPYLIRSQLSSTLVIGDASQLSVYSFSSQNNFIHLSVELESKTNASLLECAE